MRKRTSMLIFLTKLNKRVFTSREMAMISGKALSVITQALNNLVNKGLVIKVYKGIWVMNSEAPVNAYEVLPYLFPKHRAYISFISALHMYGIIGQIPQVITLATTAHSKTIRTRLGVFQAHRITPEFFSGFKWYQGNGGFLIAEPEKALVDSLYLSAHKKMYFRHFPELNFPKTFSFKKAKQWVNKIPNTRVRKYVLGQLTVLGKRF